MIGMCRFLLIIYCLTTIQPISGEEGAQYLKNAMSDLRQMKDQIPSTRPNLKKLNTGNVQAIIPANDPTVNKVVERRIHDAITPPPLSLTKGELAAIYEAAVRKGETVKIGSTSSDSSKGYVNAVVHELDEKTATPSTTPEEGSEDSTSGYYYYYYPVKSFLDELSSQSTTVDHSYIQHPDHHEIIHTEAPPYQYHSHHHEHNVKITKETMAAADDKKKGLEPLFMAISGFIGMAVMYIISIIVLPKLGLKKRYGGGHFKNGIKKNERITEMARVALQAIEGKDCEERFACELEKTARAFNIQDNRFVKLLKRMAPGTFGKQINKVGKYTKNKRLSCKAIPCKKKNPNSPKKKMIPPNNKNAQKKH